MPVSGVRLREGESFDSLLKRFRKVLAKMGSFRKLKELNSMKNPLKRGKKN